MRGLIGIPLLAELRDNKGNRGTNILPPAMIFLRQPEPTPPGMLSLVGTPQLQTQNPYGELVFRVHTQHEHPECRMARLSMISIRMHSAGPDEVQHDKSPVFSSLFEQFQRSTLPDQQTCQKSSVSTCVTPRRTNGWSSAIRIRIMRPLRER